METFIPARPFDVGMRDADAFERTVFLGLARTSKRDPYRLSLFAQHLASDEEPRILLPVQGGTLLITDRRLLELRAHLEVHGAWNVKEFQGYAIQRGIDIASTRDVVHRVTRGTDATGNRRVEDVLIVTTATGCEEILVSKGPEATLAEDEFRALRDAVLALQPK